MTIIAFRKLGILLLATVYDNDKNSILHLIYEQMDLRSVKNKEASLLLEQHFNSTQDYSEKVYYFSLVSSYIHMMLNRLFKNKQRKHEFMIYYYLWRVYDSRQHLKQKKLNKVLIN